MKHLAPVPRLSQCVHDIARQYYHIRLDPQVTLEDLLRPNFWVHHASTLREGTLIDVYSENLDVQLRVVAVDTGLARMRPLRVWERKVEVAQEEGEDASSQTDVPEGYMVKHAPRTGWRVLTIDPPMEISRQHRNRDEALAAAKAHHAKATQVAA